MVDPAPASRVSAGAVAVVVGAAHAAGVWALVRTLDYPIDGLAVAPGGTPGALVGLTLLAGLPAFLAARRRLVAPLVAAVLGVGWPVYRELTTPPPTFSTLGGHTVVHGPRYVDAYVDAWYVWLFAYGLVGLAEYVARADHSWLADPVRDARLDALLSGGPRSARRAFLVVGAAHALVFLGLATDAGSFEPGGFLPLPWSVGLGVLAWTVVGLGVVGGVPAYLLSRWRLVGPTLGLAWLVRQTGWTHALPTPDGPLPVYFLGWVAFAFGLVGLGGIEVGLREGWRRVGRGD